jgi:hypothetical protein
MQIMKTNGTCSVAGEMKDPVSAKMFMAKRLTEDLMRCGHLKIHNFQARVVRLQYI